jgi:membrane associated rhomboid family serine protease
MEQRARYKLSFGGPLTPIVKSLIIINFLAFALLFIAKDSSKIVYYLGLVPFSVIHDRTYWQFLTYMFIHVDFWHFAFNMLGLWWFGCDIERGFGGKHFLRYYLFTGIGAGISAFLLGLGSSIPTIGASGAIFGILLAYAILYPNRLIYLWLVVPVKAKWVVLGFAAVELIGVFKASESGVSHIAHLGGLVFGLVWFAYYLKIFTPRALKSFFGRARARQGMKIVKDDKPPDDDFYKPNSDGTIH